MVQETDDGHVQGACLLPDERSEICLTGRGVNVCREQSNTMVVFQFLEKIRAGGQVKGAYGGQGTGSCNECQREVFSPLLVGLFFLFIELSACEKQVAGVDDDGRGRLLFLPLEQGNFPGQTAQFVAPSAAGFKLSSLVVGIEKGK